MYCSLSCLFFVFCKSTKIYCYFCIAVYKKAMNNYNSYSNWIRRKFPFRVQKISVDAGFSCPNRDGSISFGGCSFCNNRSFNPFYCNPEKSIAQQIEEGRLFFSRKYPEMKYLAYFQAYSNTYADIDTLKRRYEEALSCEDVVGLIVGTRPDCVDDDILDYLERLNNQTFLVVEYGIESADDRTLVRINRGHDFACSRNAIAQTKERGIITGAHVIVGLPGEGSEDIIRQATLVSETGIDILKIHQLQVLRGTPLGYEYAKNPFHVFSVDEYVATIAGYIRHLRPDIVIERFVSQSPKDMLLAPDWGLKNYEFTNILNNYLVKNNIHQGDLYFG